MDLIINTNLENIPSNLTVEPAYGCYLTHFLYALHQDPYNLPLGQLLAQLEGLDGQWAVVSPIHWEASHNDAMITAYGAELGLTLEEADKIIQALSPLQFHCVNTHTWLLKMDDKPALRAVPPGFMLQRSMIGYLKELDASLYWQKLITETQMLCASLGSEVVNGLWFYGTGEIQWPAERVIVSDDIKLAGCFPDYIQLLRHPERSEGSPHCVRDDVDLALLAQPPQNLPNTNIHWWWNNCSYTTHKKTLWQRLTNR